MTEITKHIMKLYFQGFKYSFTLIIDSCITYPVLLKLSNSALLFSLGILIQGLPTLITAKHSLIMSLDKGQVYRLLPSVVA